MSPCRINTAAPNLVCLCVDQVTEGEFAGYLYHKYKKEGIPFQESALIISILDQLFDDIHYPQASTKYRSFQKKKSKRSQKEEVESAAEENTFKELVQVVTEEELLAHKGKAATFFLHVQFRQNATWQGVVTCAEKQEEARFNSVLELLKLIDQMLNETE